MMSKSPFMYLRKLGLESEFFEPTHSKPTKADQEKAARGLGAVRSAVSGSCGLDGGSLGVELLEVEEADEAVARACLGASIARVLYHAAVVGGRRPRRRRRRRPFASWRVGRRPRRPFAADRLRGKGEERGGQEEEHHSKQGCRVDV